MLVYEGEDPRTSVGVKGEDPRTSNICRPIQGKRERTRVPHFLFFLASFIDWLVRAPHASHMLHCSAVLAVKLSSFLSFLFV